MKRLLIPLLALTICLCACQKTARPTESSTSICWSEPPAHTWSVTEDITVSLAQESFPAGTENFTVTFTNSGSQILEYGENYSFQYNDGSGWKTPETIENYAFHMVAYVVLPGQSATLEVGPWFLKEPLQTGRWRIVGCALRTADDDSGFVYGGNHTEHDPYILEFDITG